MTLRVGTAGTWVALPRGIHTVSLSVHITEGALGAPRPARSRHTHSGTQEMLGLIPFPLLGEGGLFSFMPAPGIARATVISLNIRKDIQK